MERWEYQRFRVEKVLYIADQRLLLFLTKYDSRQRPNIFRLFFLPTIAAVPEDDRFVLCLVDIVVSAIF